jgi:sugar phosphate permease
VAAEEHHEEVYAPDQLKPGNRKRAQKGAIISAAIMLLFFWGNQQGNTEKVWLVLIAIGLVGVIIGDAVLRRSGLRANDQ